MESEETIYIVEKDAKYLHGVFWIGSDLEEAKRQADKYAENDKDGHHDWYVRIFKEVPKNLSQYNADHDSVYSTNKKIREAYIK